MGKDLLKTRRALRQTTRPGPRGGARWVMTGAKGALQEAISRPQENGENMALSGHVDKSLKN